MLRFRATDTGVSVIAPEQWPLVQMTAKAPAVEIVEHSCYFDTHDMALWRQGLLIVLRRRNGHVWRQIVRPRRSWLHEPLFPPWMTSRVPCPDGVLDLESIQRELDDLFKKGPRIAAGDLQPVVHMTCTRKRWLLNFPDGQSIRLLEEKGHVSAPMHPNGNQDSLFHEVVVKTTRGGLDGWMFQRVLTLVQPWAPTFVGTTPLERAFWSYGVTPDRRAPVPDLALSADTPLEVAFTRLCQFLWQKMADAHALVNGEEVASGRLGLQELLQSATYLRMLSAAYASLITDEAREQLDAELEWLIDTLAPMDQWQNFLAYGLSPFVAACQQQTQGSDPKLDKLQQRAMAQNEDHLHQIRLVLNSFRFTRLLLGFGYWFNGRLWRHRLDRRQRKQLQVHMAPSVTIVMERHYRRLLQMHERIHEIDWAIGRAIREKGEMLHALVDLFMIALRRHDGDDLFSLNLNQFCQVLHKIDYLHRFRSQLTQISPDSDSQINTRFHEWVQQQTRQASVDAQQSWEAFIHCQPFWTRLKGDRGEGGMT
ncbi:MAG: CHAD domain-containing protein [Magnetococcales bacterium]|nr:CHAD domain-containing protein [Magnetococcales bacterium]